MVDYADHYRETEDGLRLLVAVERPNLSAKDVAEVEEFLDAHEYGIALETFAAILLDEGVRLTDETVSRIQRLAESMNLYHEQAINNVVAEYERTNYRIAM